MTPVVHTPDEKLAALAKPPLQEISSLSLRPDDTLVVCAGFEDRAVAALALAVKSSPRFNLMVVGYAPFLADNRKSAIEAIVGRYPGITIRYLTYDRENPAGFGAILTAAIGCAGRIYLDISGMSRLLIVQILVALGSTKEGLRQSTILYSEAAEYPPNRAEAEQVLRRSSADPTFSALFLSSGVFEITVVPELSSVSPAPTQSRLIVFPGFDVHHLTALRAELQPSRITFIEGVPPNPENQWRTGVVAELNHIGAIAENERISTSTLRYEETVTSLVQLYQRHGLRERLLVAPTGSKMQTVAVGLFRAFVMDAQIVYSTPRGFVSPDNYTHGVRSTYELALDSFAQIL